MTLNIIYATLIFFIYKFTKIIDIYIYIKILSYLNFQFLFPTLHDILESDLIRLNLLLYTHTHLAKKKIIIRRINNIITTIKLEDTLFIDYRYLR